MATSRRRTAKSDLGQNIAELESRIKRLERRIPTFTDSYSITSDLIAPGSITQEKLDPALAALLDNAAHNADAAGNSVEYGRTPDGPLSVDIREGYNFLNRSLPCEIGFAVADEYTAMTTGTDKITFRMPFMMRVTEVRASLAVASTSGAAIFDVNENGTSILGANKLHIDADETTSMTATTEASISDVILSNNARISIDIDDAGTGAKGPKIWLIGYRL